FQDSDSGVYPNSAANTPSFAGAPASFDAPLLLLILKNITGTPEREFHRVSIAQPAAMSVVPGARRNSADSILSLQ
ncbi:MAG TPA: hypothetical protein PLI34_04655, partial [Saprospiraceae bacterium]|nr:hypothetical protein [Saprospiraceae bacterium]